MPPINKKDLVLTTCICTEQYQLLYPGNVLNIEFTNSLEKCLKRANRILWLYTVILDPCDKRISLAAIDAPRKVYAPTWFHIPSIHVVKMRGDIHCK